MEETIILGLILIIGIETIILTSQAKENNRRKKKFAELKIKYLEDINKAETSIRETKILCKATTTELKDITKKLNEYREKYNEVLRSNKELLLKAEQNKPIENVANVTEGKPKVTSARKPRKKKGDNK